MRTRLWIALACTFTLAGAGTTWSFLHDMSEARRSLAGRSVVVDSPYGRIEYADVGTGPAILVIHGSGGGFDQSLAFTRPLAGQGLRIIAPSRFGYLRSAAPPGASPETQADALGWLLDHLQVKRAVVFGGSAGALSAAQLAIRRPDLCRGLILGVPAMYAPDRAPDQNAAPNALAWSAIRAALSSDLLFWAGIRLAPDVLIRMVLATDPALVHRASPAEQRRVRDILFHILPVSQRRDGILLDSAVAGRPPPYALDRVACPVLAISLRDDLYGTAKAAAFAVSQVPSGRLIIYPTGGHVWVGHDAEVWAEVAAFVRDVETAAPGPGVAAPASLPGRR